MLFEETKNRRLNGSESVLWNRQVDNCLNYNDFIGNFSIIWAVCKNDFNRVPVSHKKLVKETRLIFFRRVSIGKRVARKSNEKSKSKLFEQCNWAWKITFILFIVFHLSYLGRKFDRFWYKLCKYLFENCVLTEFTRIWYWFILPCLNQTFLDLKNPHESWIDRKIRKTPRYWQH